MKTLVYCSDKYKWLIGAFAYLHNVYWSEMQPVVVLGFSPPEQDLPDNFEFVSAAPEDPGAEKWTNGLITFLRGWDEFQFVFLLEDYLLSRLANVRDIESLGAYMATQPDVLRIDLTNDRLHSGGAVDIGAYGCMDIIETAPHVPYRFSLQAAIYNKDNLLKCLKPNMGPWDVELQGEDIIPDGMRVLGTRNNLLVYTNSCGMQLDSKYTYRTVHVREGAGGKTIQRIEPHHVEEMKRLGLLPDSGYHGD